MTKEKSLDIIEALGLLAVFRESAPDTSLRMVLALVEGSVYDKEIIYTTPQKFLR